MALEDAGASPGLVIEPSRATLPEPPVMRAGTGNQRKRRHSERADIDCDRRREDCYSPSRAQRWLGRLGPDGDYGFGELPRSLSDIFFRPAFLVEFDDVLVEDEEAAPL